MDFKKTGASQECITRNIKDFDKTTGNIYETVVILSQRANQISSQIKEELTNKINEYTQTIRTENIEEVIENREQVEIAKLFETIPKPTLLATQELINDQIDFIDTSKEL